MTLSAGSEAKIPEEVVFKTKNELGVEFVERAVEWEIPRAPVLGDQAYGDDSKLRERLDRAGSEYVLSVGATAVVFGPETEFEVPERRPGPRPPTELPASGSRSRVDRRADRSSWARLGADGDLPRRTRRPTARVPFCVLAGSRCEPVAGTRSAVGQGGQTLPREEWLIPSGPKTTTAERLLDLELASRHQPDRLARLARMRWKIELDYKQLKGELGLDHYEGRSWLGWYHHTALVTAAHGFLTLERLNPFARGRPDPPEDSPTPSAPLQVLDRPLPDVPAIG